MTPAAKRRWFRFSLRTLFVVVTVFGCWLGWNLHHVRQRFAMYELIVERNGSFDSQPPTQRTFMVYGNNWIQRQTGQELPTTWRMLGARPIKFIDVRREQFSPEELTRIQRLFPEADIAEWYFSYWNYAGHE